MKKWSVALLYCLDGIEWLWRWKQQRCTELGSGRNIKSDDKDG
ncbi:MAG: hypothetical protein ACLVJ6_05100 [Merdibacter sp.]